MKARNLRAKKANVNFVTVRLFTVFVMDCFVSDNVNGLRDPVKRSSFCFWLGNLSADVICLQELHCVSDSEVKMWFPSFSVVASAGSNKSCGVAILFKSKFSFVDRASDDSDDLFGFVFCVTVVLLMWSRFMHPIGGLTVFLSFPLLPAFS